MAMVKSPFNGQLNSNEIFASIYNMIISQQVFSDNIKGTYGELVSDFKVDGTLYGDTKLFYATDILKSRKWTNYNEAGNLLQTNRPADPKCQAITLDQFRQIDITLDKYLSKRAWSTEGAFSQFQSVVMQMVSETKRIYEATLINSYVGTVKSEANRAEIEIGLAAIKADKGLNAEEKNRLEAETIAESLANLFVDMKDISRDFNDYQFLRSYDLGDLLVVWNSKYVNKIRKVDLPTIFHKDGLMDKFEDRILPSRYFGKVDTVGGTVGTTAALVAGKVRAIDEMDCKNSGGDILGHVFAGDVIPTGSVIKANEGYIVDENVICKVVHKDAIKFMSAFEVATSFFNPRSLTENHYLTWGYSAPDHLKNYPIVVVHEN